MDALVRERVRTMKHGFLFLLNLFNASTTTRPPRREDVVNQVAAISSSLREITATLAATPDGRELYGLVAAWLNEAQQHIRINSDGYWTLYGIMQIHRPPQADVVMSINRYLGRDNGDETVLLPLPPQNH